jgi:hypothetical protein
MAKIWENIETMARLKLVKILDELVKKNNMQILIPYICALMINMFQSPAYLRFWFKFDSANSAVNSAGLVGSVILRGQPLRLP